MTFRIVVAADEDGGIGKAGDLPWKLPGDMAFFKRLTSETEDPSRQNAVIMGRKTWDSIPLRFRPLRHRINAVLSRSTTLSLPENVLLAEGLEDALAKVAAHRVPIESVFVIGGGQIYQDALNHEACEIVHLTRVEGRFDCDTFLPPLGERFVRESSSPRQEDHKMSYVFETWKRLKHE